MKAAEAATTSVAHESPVPRGRPGDGAAAARTEALYAAHARTVGSICRALLRDPAEAEDAAQQTFLGAHRALANGIEPREPAAWLAAIARNECRARIRARMREPLAGADVESVAAVDDPLAESIRRADLASVWRAVDALPRQQRDALLLRELGGMSYEELAAALGVSGPAVESLLVRARRTLRAAYASLAGASWLEWLARLLAGGAPVTAKVAAVGVGAAALAGGAVVGPQVLDDHHPRAPASSVHVRPAAGPRRHAAARVPADRVDRTVPPRAAAVATERRAPVEEHHAAAAERFGDDGMSRPPAASERSDGGTGATEGGSHAGTLPSADVATERRGGGEDVSSGVSPRAEATSSSSVSVEESSGDGGGDG